MDLPEHVTVTDQNGISGVVDSTSLFTQETAKKLIRFEKDRWALVPDDRLVLQEDGHYAFQGSLLDFEQYPRSDIAREQGNNEVIVPIVEEKLHVDKRRTETGKVRIRKTVDEHEEMVELPLLQEEVEVIRVPVNQTVDAPVSVRREGNTIIVPIHREEIVIQKRLVLEEELHIRKKAQKVEYSESVPVRREEVHIERVHTGSAPSDIEKIDR